MRRVWRLVTSARAKSAFTGDGAKRYGGRWNHKGTPIVYTAESQSLAMLEMLVQDEPLRARYVVIPADIPESLPMERVDLNRLPRDWRASFASDFVRNIGSDWAQSQKTAVLAVPSAIIPAETNYLLNPLHPRFKEIKIGRPAKFTTDLQLVEA